MSKRNDEKNITKSKKRINERCVKALAAARGWTQEDLAREAGLNLSYLNRIIRNQRYVDRHVDKIAKAFGVSTRRILESIPSEGVTP